MSHITICQVDLQNILQLTTKYLSDRVPVKFFFGVGDLYVGVESANASAYVCLSVSHDCKLSINDNTFNHLQFLIGVCIFQQCTYTNSTFWHQWQIIYKRILHLFHAIAVSMQKCNKILHFIYWLTVRCTYHAFCFFDISLNETNDRCKVAL